MEGFLKMKANKTRKIVTAIMVCVMFALTLGTASATVSSIDYWDLHYIANAPASVNLQCKSLTIYTYGSGYVTKAQTLSGSYDRRVKVEGRNGYNITNQDHYILLTSANALSSVFYTNKINGENKVYFMSSALGNLTCTSEGFVSINDSSIYNNA